MGFNYWQEWKNSFFLTVKNPQIFWATLIFSIIIQCISVIILFLGNKTAEFGRLELLMSYMLVQIIFFIISVGGSTFILGGMMNSVSQVCSGKNMEISDFFNNAKKDFWEYLGFVGIVAIGYIFLLSVFAGLTAGLMLLSYSISSAIPLIIVPIITVLFILLVIYLFSRIIFALPLLADFKVISQGLKFSWKFPLKSHQYKTVGVIFVTYVIMGLITIPFYISNIIPTNFELTQLTPQYATNNVTFLALFFLLSYLSLFITIANQFFIYKSYKLYAPEAAKK